MSVDRVKVSNPTLRLINYEEYTKTANLVCDKIKKKLGSDVDRESICIIALSRNGLFTAQILSYKLPQRPQIIVVDPKLLQRGFNSMTAKEVNRKKLVDSGFAAQIKDCKVIIIDSIYASGTSLGSVKRYVDLYASKPYITACLYRFLPDCSTPTDITGEELAVSNSDLWIQFPWEV